MASTSVCPFRSSIHTCVCVCVCVCRRVKVKVKVEVYSLVSSAKRYSPDFTQLPPGNRTCSFISHLNSPGSIQPGCHFRRTALFKHTSLHCPTRYPLTPGSRECTCEQSALPRSTTSKHIQRCRGSNPRSLASKSRTLPLSHDAPQCRCVCVCVCVCVCMCVERASGSPDFCFIIKPYV